MGRQVENGGFPRFLKDVRKGGCDVSARKKEGCLTRLFTALIALLCALVLGGLFYATMVYQLAGEDAAPSRVDNEAALRVISLGESTLVRQEAGVQEFGGAKCSVITREYALDDGASALAISATPAAYMERLSLEGWTPQLITGFMLAQLDAVYEQNGDRAMLVAREGDAVYLIEAEAGEEALYALGVGASLEEYEGAQP